MATGGFIKIDRKLLEWRYAQHPMAMALWIRLLLKANWTDGYFYGKEIPRGSLAASVKTLAEETGIAENTVRRWLKKFEENGEITTETTNRFTIITIPKYNDFQNATRSEVSNQVSTPVSEQVSKQMSTQLSNQVSNQLSKQMSKPVGNDIRIKELKEEKEEELKNYSPLEERLARRRAEGLAPKEPPAPSPYPPTIEDVREEIKARGFHVDPDVYFNYREVEGWKRNWKADIALWEARDNAKKQSAQQGQQPKEITPKPEAFSTEDDPEVRAKLLKQLKGEL